MEYCVFVACLEICMLTPLQRRVVDEKLTSMSNCDGCFDDGTRSTVLTLCRQLVYNIIKSKQNRANQNKNANNKQ